VLTKADTVKPGEEGKWFSVIRNQEFPLDHGYYITRQPSTKERQDGIRREQATAQETAFFSSESCFWSKESKNRLGTENLAQALSKRLSRMIGQTHAPRKL
jgi:hypothetical protein